MFSLAVLGWLTPPPYVAPRRSGSISMLKDSYDLVVLGGGPVGITGALRATSLGKSAILVDATPQSQFQFTGPTGLFSKALRDASLRIDVPVLRSMGIGDAAIWAQVRELVQVLTRLARTVAVRTPQRLSSSMSDEPLSAKELRKELRRLKHVGAAAPAAEIAAMEAQSSGKALHLSQCRPTWRAADWLQRLSTPKFGIGIAPD